MTYNTMNPVPSLDPRDLDDNAQAFDRFLQSTAASEPDRRGVLRKTWHQMELDAAALVSPNVSALAAAVAAVNKGVYFSATGPVVMSTYDLHPFVRGISNSANQAAFRTAIGAISSSDSITGSAAKLTTPRAIAATGDASWTVNFDGSAAVSAALTLANSGVTAGTYGSVTVDAKGRATAGSVATPIANGGTGATTQAGAQAAILGAFTMIALPLNNSWTVVSPRRAVYRKEGDCVRVEVAIANGTATDGTVVATLPAGFRPPIQFSIPVSAAPATAPSSTVGVPRVVFNTDGTITCLNVTSGGGINFNTTFSLS